MAILFFLGGAVIGGRLVRRNRMATRILADVLALNVGLLLVAALIAGYGNIATNQLSQYASIALLSIAMGGQLSATRHVNVPDLAFPVATSIIHGLAHDSWFAGGRFIRGYRRAGVVVALLAGAAAGAGLSSLAPWAAILLATSLLGGAAWLASGVPGTADAGGGQPMALP